MICFIYIYIYCWISVNNFNDKHSRSQITTKNENTFKKIGKMYFCKRLRIFKKSYKNY